ncbi:hypothetical protein ACFSTC_13485 [Nonomuraea ferruginea]
MTASASLSAANSSAAADSRRLITTMWSTETRPAPTTASSSEAAPSRISSFSVIGFSGGATHSTATASANRTSPITDTISPAISSAPPTNSTSMVTVAQARGAGGSLGLELDPGLHQPDFQLAPAVGEEDAAHTQAGHQSGEITEGLSHGC